MDPVSAKMALQVGLSLVRNRGTRYLVVGLLLLTHDWRMMFILLGVFSLLAMALFARTFSDSPEKSPHTNTAERQLIQTGQRRSAGDSIPLPWWVLFHSSCESSNAERPALSGST